MQALSNKVKKVLKGILLEHTLGEPLAGYLGMALPLLSWENFCLWSAASLYIASIAVSFCVFHIPAVHDNYYVKYMTGVCICANDVTACAFQLCPLCYRCISLQL